jgi:hypothetical protein
VAAGLAALVVAAGLLRMAPGVCGVYHDDAIYVSSAQALAQGDGYRVAHVPGSPAQTKYPILYPGMLALVWRLAPQFPDNLAAMQALSLCCGALAIATGYLLLVRRGYFGRPIACAAAALTGTSASYVYFCTTTMAEGPFALALVGALAALDGWLSSAAPARQAPTARVGVATTGPDASWLAGLLVGAAAAAPMLLRTIGAAVVLAGFAVAWRRRLPRLAYVLGAASVAGPWLVWSWLHRVDYRQDPLRGYYTDYVGSWQSEGWVDLARIAAVNAASAAYGVMEFVGEGLLTGGSRPLSWDAPACALALVACGGGAWLAVFAALPQGRIVPWCLACYAATALVWPWMPHRFLAPIQLFVAAYLLQATVGLAQRLPDKWRPAPAWGAVAAGLLLAGNAALLLQHRQIVRELGYPMVRLGDPLVLWASYEDLFDWVRTTTSPDDVVVTGFDSMLSLYTGRPAIRPFASRPGRLFYRRESEHEAERDAAQLEQTLWAARPAFLIASPMPGFAEDEPFQTAIHMLADRYPEWLRPVYQGADARFAAYAVAWQHAPQQVARASIAPSDGG